MSPRVQWADRPEDHDYPNAASYLRLITDDTTVASLIKTLKAAPIRHQKAKDILRAAQLPLLETTNPHVKSDLDKVHDGVKLSPILLVRGDLAAGVPLQIADGYHRVCASYHVDENTDIPVQMVDVHDVAD